MVTRRKLRRRRLRREALIKNAQIIINRMIEQWYKDNKEIMEQDYQEYLMRGSSHIYVTYEPKRGFVGGISRTDKAS